MPYLNQKGKVVISAEVQVCVPVDARRPQSNTLHNSPFGFVVLKNPALLSLSGKNENKWKMKGNFSLCSGVKSRLSASA